jgi:hypothetical protein
MMDHPGSIVYLRRMAEQCRCAANEKTGEEAQELVALAERCEERIAERERAGEALAEED